ncbi:cation diffusion facilitator family transporter [Hoeflea sp.]|uniref:cation diffusion facilitator family transporter n=1 Tax=Hoeflea sp. TaxID=1940281 RepID=UPI003B028DA1
MRFLREATREPSQIERAKERSIFYTIIADLIITALQLLVAALTGSLTMLSESIRCILMDTVEIYSYWMLRGVHRGRMHHFQFGIGKIEQFAWMIFGTSLFLSGLWLTAHVFQSVFEYQPAPSPVGLAFAAFVNAINFLINILSFYAILSASDQKESDIFRAQRRSRGLKTLTSAILQVTLTIAAISSDPVVAKVMDGIGALLVAAIMVVTGGAMMARALPDLLDAPLSGTSFERIMAAIAATAGATMDISAIRTRRSGRFPQVEITLSHIHTGSVAELQERIRELRRAIADLDEQIELSVVIADEKK